MKDREEKIARIAAYLEGRLVPSELVDISIKGIILGFPTSLEAFKPNFPFGLNYFVETKVIEDPSAEAVPLLQLNISARHSKGILAKLLRLILFEPRGQKLQQLELDKIFVASFNDSELATHFARHPGVAEILTNLYRCSKFSELIIKSDAGIFLAQPTSFDAVDVDSCLEVFKLLGDLGQVIFDSFS
jgi:hypothetical protein